MELQLPTGNLSGYLLWRIKDSTFKCRLRQRKQIVLLDGDGRDVTKSPDDTIAKTFTIVKSTKFQKLQKYTSGHHGHYLQDNWNSNINKKTSGDVQEYYLLICSHVTNKSVVTDQIIDCAFFEETTRNKIELDHGMKEARTDMCGHPWDKSQFQELLSFTWNLVHKLHIFPNLALQGHQSDSRSVFAFTLQHWNKFQLEGSFRSQKCCYYQMEILANLDFSTNFSLYVRKNGREEKLDKLSTDLQHYIPRLSQVQSCGKIFESRLGSE
ncbi:hypothetical protein POM88_038222 [Heracleum sosnowskyi]|uniref:Uncharacterized protein n=1 Tax=Heracleum sosnowskyi TaxID=360622 RepID=A0AAD8HU45_9APIA|nr:hypothetical protein POM88_038222 [Heracleum sosnowskyi]